MKNSDADHRRPASSLMVSLNLLCQESGSLHMCLLLALVLLLVQAPVGTVSGCVIDSAREVISNATIVVRQEESGVERKTFTNANGDYLAANLPPGNYILV